MKKTLIAAFALSLGLSGAAFAQSNTTSGGTVDSTTGEINETQPTMGGMEWPEEVSGVFYSDMENYTLRTQEEAATGWAALTAEQQAQVRSDCDGMMAEAPTTEQKSGDVADNDNIDENPTASIETSSMTEACGWVAGW